MPWERRPIVSQREEFVRCAQSLGNVSEACRRFGISRPTGYKWLRRYQREGREGLADRCRRPQRSPNKTSEAMEQAVLQVRENHAAWGGRKIRRRLLDQGRQDVPVPSTITEILRRHGKLDSEEASKHAPYQRFEAEAPNGLWQMDFKGHFESEEGRCHPLTVLDDHSRYALELGACPDESHETVKGRMEALFVRYGLPEAILTDNGAPWGVPRQAGEGPSYTRLTVWWITLGIRPIHSRPYHPQTLGKDERFHRTFKAEVQASCLRHSRIECQRRFDTWRSQYNHIRPHEALSMEVPASRYEPSRRRYPPTDPSWTYPPQAQVRKVDYGGAISVQARKYRVGQAFRRQDVGLYETKDGRWDVYFRSQFIKTLDPETCKS